MSAFQGDGNSLKLEFTKFTKDHYTLDFVVVNYTSVELISFFKKRCLLSFL